jgi:hypothetical protein
MEAALALHAKLNAWISPRLPADSFEAKYYRYSEEWWRAISEQQLGDLRPALEHGRTLVPKLESIMPDNRARYMPFGNGLTNTYLWLAQAAYVLDDAASAERFATRGLEVRKLFGIMDLGDKRLVANLQAIRGLALAKVGRVEEAQAQAAAALKAHRELAALKRDDPSQAFEVATALYAAAVVGKTNQAAMLAEAATLMDKLPPEMQHMASVRMWRERIAAERAARH